METKHRNKTVWKRWGAAALCLCMIFTTACGNGKEDSVKAMGRYVEQRLEFPEKDQTPIQMLQRSDGTLDLYYTSNDIGTQYEKYHSADGQNWEASQVKWNVPKGQYFNRLAYDENDAAYLMTTSYGKDGATADTYVYRMDQKGGLEQIPMDWRDENGGKPKLGIMGAMQIGDGRIFVDQGSSGVGQYGLDGSFQRLYSAGSGSSTQGFANFTLQENKLYVIDGSGNSVLSYNIGDGSLSKTIPFDNFAENTQIASGQGGAVYLYNRNGVFRLVKDGSLWEKLIDGSLTSFIIPTLYFSELTEGTDGAFYLMGGDGQNQAQLYKYVYDKNIASLPEKELTVYSLGENALLRQTAGEFQLNHPDTRVNLQVAMGEASAATKSDLIRALNTELLNGKGPDVILLDGMPVDSYIEKGVLADLSGIIKDLNGSETMNKTVMDTFQKKDGLFAVPTTFQIPVIITDRSYAADMKDLNSLTAFAQSQGSKPLIGDKSPDRLMQIFFSSCLPAWMQGGQIDSAKLKTFLEDMKTITDTPAKSYATEDRNVRSGGQTAILQDRAAADARQGSASSVDTLDDMYHWAFGRSLAFTSQLAGDSAMMRIVLAMRHQGNATMVPLPGQAGPAYIPMGIMGINAKSENQDSAKEFLKLMLSEKIQQAANNREGFSVNLAALNDYISKTDSNLYFSIQGSSYDENEELEGEMPTSEEKKSLLALCNSVETPYLADETLTDAIRKEAQGYFTGEKNVDQTVADIQEATKLYLSE